MSKTENIAAAHDYTNLVNLLAVYSEANNRMLAMQADIQAQYMELIDGAKSEYAKLQAVLGETETALESLALTHPEWFPEKRKSIKTPYGTVKLTSTTSLEVANEEATIILIEKSTPENQTKFLRSKVELNREALETLSDAELRSFRIKRIQEESFSVTAAKLDMGKAVKEAAKADGKKVA